MTGHTSDERAALIAEAEALHLRSTTHQHAKLMEDALTKQRSESVIYSKGIVRIVLALLDEHEAMNRRLAAALEATPTTAEGEALVDSAKEFGLRILLQLAVDEMRNVIEAVDHRHETRSDHLKYSTPYGAINGLTKVREDILVQCAMWGVDVSPKRPAPSPETDEAAFEAAAQAIATEMRGAHKGGVTEQDRRAAHAALSAVHPIDETNGHSATWHCPICGFVGAHHHTTYAIAAAEVFRPPLTAHPAANTPDNEKAQ